MPLLDERGEKEVLRVTTQDVNVATEESERIGYCQIVRPGEFAIAQAINRVAHLLALRNAKEG